MLGKKEVEETTMATAFHPFAHFFTGLHLLFFVRALEAAVVEADVYDIAPEREAHVTEAARNTENEMA